MKDYQTVIVGTDGSDSSLHAVDRAGQIAGVCNAKLIVATAYVPRGEDRAALDAAKDDGYLVADNAPIDTLLHKARERAAAAGATSIDEQAVVGNPADVLVDLAKATNADLMVIGNVGLGTVAGRLLGSVPATVARRSNIDVLIVHTS